MKRVAVSVVLRDAAKLESFVQHTQRWSLPSSEFELWLAIFGSDLDTGYERASEAESGIHLRTVENEAEAHNAHLAQTQVPLFLILDDSVDLGVDTITQLVSEADHASQDVVAFECAQSEMAREKIFHPLNGETPWSALSCVLFRTHALRKVGGLDARLDRPCRDMDLSFRLRACGWTLRYYEEITVNATEPAQSVPKPADQLVLRLRYGHKLDLLRFLLGRLPESGSWYSRIRAACQVAPRGRRSKLVGKKIDLTSAGLVRLKADAPAIEDGPMVSIVVRTHGERQMLLAEALTTLQRQTYRNLEIVVVEDGSRLAENTVIACSGPAQVAYYPVPKQGRSRCGNYGLAVAKGAYLGFLDDDDLLYSDHIASLVAVLEKGEFAAYSVGLEVGTLWISGHEYRECQWMVRYRKAFDRRKLQIENFLPIQTVLFRRELYERLGGFDEELDQLEDWNLWARYGWVADFRFVDRITSLYRVPFDPHLKASRQVGLDSAYRNAHQRNLNFQSKYAPGAFMEPGLSIMLNH
ncbi:MAG: glycosyltransferase [Acidobacteria bacterium]|nr:glycosyltransferase [Acidobacteriota bacterium]